MGDTWEWDGAAWALRSTGGPPARYWHAMAYDSGRHVTVLFGGVMSEGGPSDTWEWDGTTWTLQSTSGPSWRYWHAMAYDSARGVTVLFGGDPDQSGATWEWDGTTWIQVSTSGPHLRNRHAMTYDSRRGVTVLFGGQHDIPIPGIYHLYLGDTWEWDGVSWSLRSETGPAPRDEHTLVYDDTRGVTMVFGGKSPSVDALSWEWDGISWTPREETGPAPRYEQGMAYDSARGVAVTFGGYTGVIRGDTWERACNPECTEALVAEVYPSSSGAGYATKNRYLSFTVPSLPSGAGGVALRVTLGPMPQAGVCPGVQDFSAFNDVEMWVGPEVMLGGTTPTGVFALQSGPLFRNWSTVPGGVIKVSDCNVVPCATYTIDAISDIECGDAAPPSFSPPLVLSTTATWGDIVGANNLEAADGVVDFIDISALVDRFRDQPGAPPRTWCDVGDERTTQGVNFNIDFGDISLVVDAFRGYDYPFPGPTAPVACAGTP